MMIKEMRNRKLSGSFLSWMLCGTLMLCTVSGCGIEKENEDLKKEAIHETEVNISVVDEAEKTEKEENLSEVVKEEKPYVSGMVTEAVRLDLEGKGYTATPCMAFSNDEKYNEIGLGYYDSEFNLFDGDTYYSMGFVTIIGPNDEYIQVPEDCEYVAVEPIEDSLEIESEYNILAYTCESLDYNHFVYDDKYVIYYQLDSTTIKYEEFENTTDNYDLSIGSLYDYDNDTYIYNANLFTEYKTHSGVELFSEEDYEELEKNLQLISDEQLRNGYYVEEINIVYISPESIEAYLASTEEGTFFGYSVSELEEAFGTGTALVYTEEGFQTATYYQENPEDYNWKGFLTKLGVGAGIIIVGAVLTPVTGGASFGCALITITQFSAGMALSQGLSTLAIETVTGLIAGEDFSTAIMHASCKGLDSFANGFMIGAAIGSVGVVSGLIKPVACFVAGTLVAIPGDNGVEYKPIEEISPGDLVYSYDTWSQTVEIGFVTERIEKSANNVMKIRVEGEDILVTEDHPFYNPCTNEWIPAKELSVGDCILTIDGTEKYIEDIGNSLEAELTVYNLTVDNNHDYFVSEIGVLVHNLCTEYARHKAVKDAWKKEVEAVKNGKSKYNWTRKEMKELLANGKVKGYDGCHIVDVKVNPELAANADNIIFLKRSVHFNLVHGGNWKNASSWSEVVKIMPQFAEQVMAMGGAL